MQSARSPAADKCGEFRTARICRARPQRLGPDAIALAERQLEDRQSDYGNNHGRTIGSHSESILHSIYFSITIFLRGKSLNLLFADY
ncbi:hypothetical protein Y032_0352g3257 [Ancylostoma ceylanicum]|uniref:Uncharacterized protein n=1 Tax=Ancylostoma ceylanicum TaxID=53326 RepID=A0A016RWL0_9BILA|nr:hypothetical protein Y032_0352g3257 [Ancylostoma ceylanicum]